MIETVKKGFAFFDKGAAACRSALSVRLQQTESTFARREVFYPAYMPPEKTDQNFFAPAGANSARLFRQTESSGPLCGPDDSCDLL